MLPLFSLSVLDLMAEVLEVAGKCAKSHNRRRIQPRDIHLGIDGDDELAKLCRDVIMPRTGAWLLAAPSINEKEFFIVTNRHPSVC